MRKAKAGARQASGAAKKVGRPSDFTAATADYILAEMVENGRALVAVCGDPGMPARSTVYRWLAEHPDFAARVDRAREAIADHAVATADRLTDDLKPEMANAVRVQLLHLHWKAAKMAPKRYSERRLTELTGKDGGPVEIEESPMVFDVSTMAPEDRQVLRALLLSMKARMAGESS